jgi:hypothetical protein
VALLCALGGIFHILTPGPVPILFDAFVWTGATSILSASGVYPSTSTASTGKYAMCWAEKVSPSKRSEGRAP